MKARMNKFYFDTYALVEIYKGSPNYLKYSKDVYMILHKLNLMEYVHFLLREKRNENLQKTFANLSSSCVECTDEIFIEAAKMKLKFKKENLSFVDCIGYLIAKEQGIKFLTGDWKFKNKENVEFVK